MRKKENPETSIWISNTDLMSGLLVVFLFISILMTQSVSEITEKTDEAKQNLQSNLTSSFTAEELSEYNLDPQQNGGDIGHASFDKGESRFKVGSSELTPEFQATLKAFLPSYIKAIYDTNEQYKKEHNGQECIQEIRIEGHTSSEWHNANVPPNIAYINNMELSQSRTREIIKFALSLPELVPYHTFIKEKLTANGLSSSHQKTKIENGQQVEDKEASRRIEFRVVANNEETLKNIKEAMNE